MDISFSKFLESMSWNRVWSVSVRLHNIPAQSYTLTGLVSSKCQSFYCSHSVKFLHPITHPPLLIGWESTGFCLYVLIYWFFFSEMESVWSMGFCEWSHSLRMSWPFLWVVVPFHWWIVFYSVDLLLLLSHYQWVGIYQRNRNQTLNSHFNWKMHLPFQKVKRQQSLHLLSDEIPLMR